MVEIVVLGGIVLVAGLVFLVLLGNERKQQRETERQLQATRELSEQAVQAWDRAEEAWNRAAAAWDQAEATNNSERAQLELGDMMQERARTSPAPAACELSSLAQGS